MYEDVSTLNGHASTGRVVSENGAPGRSTHLVAGGERHLDDPQLVIGFGFQFQDDAAAAEDLRFQNDVMLAATVDVGDMFPGAQRLDGHELAGCQMVWFHPRNRRRIGTDRGPVSASSRGTPWHTRLWVPGVWRIQCDPLRDRPS